MSSQPSFLRSGELARELLERPGLIPINLDARQQQLLWMDLEGFHFYDGFFSQGLAMFQALRRTPARFVSGLDVLDKPVPGGLEPTGFIFHAGRCGSTLLTRILARSRSHVVLGEAAPHNQFWDIFDQPWPPAATPDAIRRYRNLVMALGRRRLPTHAAHYVKFTSWNILALPFIRAAFPDVPVLFVHRDPVETLVSMLANPPGWLADAHTRARVTGVADAAAASLDHLAAAQRGLARMMRAALEADGTGLRFFDYPQLTAAHLPVLLEFFHGQPTSEELAQMHALFGYAAKQSGGAKPFSPDSKAKQQTATLAIRAAVVEELQSLHAALRQTPARLVI